MKPNRFLKIIKWILLIIIISFLYWVGSNKYPGNIEKNIYEIHKTK